MDLNQIIGRVDYIKGNLFACSIVSIQQQLEELIKELEEAKQKPSVKNDMKEMSAAEIQARQTGCAKCGEPQYASCHRKENVWFMHEYEKPNHQ